MQSGFATSTMACPVVGFEGSKLLITDHAFFCSRCVATQDGFAMERFLATDSGGAGETTSSAAGIVVSHCPNCYLYPRTTVTFVSSLCIYTGEGQGGVHYTTTA
jgi:hypothetical protein